MWLGTSCGKVQTKSFSLQTYLCIEGANAMPCETSLRTVEIVYNCPRNRQEWEIRKNIKNCSSIYQPCVEPNMFVYHCVLNENGTNMIEVCAPRKNIFGTLKHI